MSDRYGSKRSRRSNSSKVFFRLERLELLEPLERRATNYWLRAWNRSCNPSPTRLSAKTVIMIASPG